MPFWNTLINQNATSSENSGLLNYSCKPLLVCKYAFTRIDHVLQSWTAFRGDIVSEWGGMGKPQRLCVGGGGVPR